MLNEYSRRIVDGLLDEIFPHLSAIIIEGARGVGKTTTALQRATTVFRLDQARVREIVELDFEKALRSPKPILFDEWQHLPEIFDRVRRAVDDGADGGSFLLTGSAYKHAMPVHSGAGRIDKIFMMPFSLAERGLQSPKVSLSELMGGERKAFVYETTVTLNDYIDEIDLSGFPGWRTLPAAALENRKMAYLNWLVHRDLPNVLAGIRYPKTLMSWLRAYAGATGTTASFEKIRAAATGHFAEKPSREATASFRDALHQLWLLTPVEGWGPSNNVLKRLSRAPKHFLVDPSLSAFIANIHRENLLARSGVGKSGVQPHMLLGALFESLVAQSLQVYARAASCEVGHMRSWSGEREIDFIVEGRGGRVVALEVKLKARPNDEDVQNLLWLRNKLGDKGADFAVITAGAYAYRRKDGIAVIPAALLGP